MPLRLHIPTRMLYYIPFVHRWFARRIFKQRPTKRVVVDVLCIIQKRARTYMRPLRRVAVDNRYRTVLYFVSVYVNK